MKRKKKKSRRRQEGETRRRTDGQEDRGTAYTRANRNNTTPRKSHGGKRTDTQHNSTANKIEINLYWTPHRNKILPSRFRIC